MQACEGYIENGRFYPTGKVLNTPERLRAILTILDESARLANVKESNDEKQNLRSAWLKRLNAAINLSLDEEFPDIPRSTFMREPVDLTD